MRVSTQEIILLQKYTDEELSLSSIVRNLWAYIEFYEDFDGDALYVGDAYAVISGVPYVL